MVELPVRNWRILEAEPSGMLVWFDPKCELVKIYRTPHRDGEAVRTYYPGLAETGGSGYLDKVVSVRADEAEAEPASKGVEQVEIPEGDLDLPF